MLRIDPQSRAAWLLKARAFFWEYRLEEAQATLAPLLASDPDDSLLNLHMAAFLRRTDPERAAEFERRALAQFPEEAEAWYLRGLLAGRAGEGVEPIKVEAYSKALALNPRHFRSRNYRAWAFFELGRFEDMLADGGRASCCGRSGRTRGTRSLSR
jgi:tetratricopeptide (TPR) repeat protein